MENYLKIMEQLANEEFQENKATKLKIKAGIETTKVIFNINKFKILYLNRKLH